jgi:hypothetical protein
LFVTVFAFTPASYNMINNLIPRSRLCSFKTLYTLTYDLLATTLVPPTSLRSYGARRDTRNVHKTLYLDGKNRAMVCSLRLCTGTQPPIQNFCSQPPCSNQHKRHFIAGPLAGIHHTYFAQLNSQAHSKNVFCHDTQLCNICYIFSTISQDLKDTKTDN